MTNNDYTMGEISSLIPLKVVSNVANWNRALRCELACADLLECVTKHVAEPDKVKKPDEQAQYLAYRQSQGYEDHSSHPQG